MAAETQQWLPLLTSAECSTTSSPSSLKFLNAPGSKEFIVARQRHSNLMLMRSLADTEKQLLNRSSVTRQQSVGILKCRNDWMKGKRHEPFSNCNRRNLGPRSYATNCAILQMHKRSIWLLFDHRIHSSFVFTSVESWLYTSRLMICKEAEYRNSVMIRSDLFIITIHNHNYELSLINLFQEYSILFITITVD